MIPTFERLVRAEQKPGDIHLWPEMTIGHLMGAIFSISDIDAARDFKQSYVEWQTEHHEDAGPQKYTPAQVVDLNIGWCFGDGMDPERIKMWSALGRESPDFWNDSANAGTSI